MVSENTIHNNLLSQEDIMVTLANIVNFKLPKNAGEDSTDFSKGIFTKEKTTTRNSVIYHSIKGGFAIRNGDWVLVKKKTGSVTLEPDWIKKQNNNKQDNTPMVLYNIADDPSEQVNLN